MLGGGNVRSKVYASCLEVFRTLATCSFWVRGFKDKNTMHECTQGSKTHISYRECIERLKSKNPHMNHKYPASNATNNVPVMSLENEIKEVRDGLFI